MSANMPKMTARQKKLLMSELSSDGDNNHEKLKDSKLLKLFAAHIVNNTRMSSMTLQEALAMDSDNSSDESNDDEDDEEEPELTDDEDCVDGGDADDEDYDEDDDEEETDSAATDSQMCSDCKCSATATKNSCQSNGVNTCGSSAAAAAATNLSSKKSSQKNSPAKTKKKGSIDSCDETTKRFVERLSREDSQQCSCEDCMKFATDKQSADDMAVKLVADEEKKKKRSEKKKMQKKKKRDKKKAEKELATNAVVVTKTSSMIVTKSDCQLNSSNNSNENNMIIKNNANNSNNISTKSVDNKRSIDNQNVVNTDKNMKNSAKQTEPTAKSTKDKPNEPKNVSKKAAKNATKNTAPADAKQNKKNNSKQQNGGKSGHNLGANLTSNKWSPPKSGSDKDGDQLTNAANDSDGLEEEELSFSSAFISQIAQRKSKISINQKTTTTTVPTNQLYTTSSSSQSDNIYDYGHKNGSNFSDNNNTFDNQMNGNYANSNGFNTNNNYNSTNLQNSFNNNYNKTNSNNNNSNKETDDGFPKYKQYFYEQNRKPAKPSAGPSLTKAQLAQNVEKSIELAIQANEKANENKFTEAIDLFTQALAYNPNDYRFYVNRSYCYDSIQDFRNALKDAETAIGLRPDWPKCHYRRGKALAGLKNYQESEIALKKVLTLEADCDEALSELFHVRYGAIVDMGYDTQTANTYSSQYDSIDAALNALSLKCEERKVISATRAAQAINNGGGQGFGHKNGSFSDDDIYISDDEFTAAIREPTYEETSPTNPFGWKALWIGNVALDAKLDTVTALFRKFGPLNYCNIFKGTNGGSFILVHYDNAQSPCKAMTKYQGKVIPGVSIKDTPLTIRFRPNKDQKKPNYDQRLESDECYYWRTTGCARGDKCLYKHIQSNRGVDKQAWMCNPLKKGLQPFQKTK